MAKATQSNATTFVPGDQVLLHGLVGRPELNGQVGKVGARYSESERYSVHLNESGKTVKIKSRNLQHAVSSPSPAPAPAPTSTARRAPLLFVAGGRFFQTSAAAATATPLDEAESGRAHRLTLPTGCNWEVRMVEQDSAAATVTVTLDASKPEAPQDEAAWDELRGLRLTRTIRAADGEDAASSEVSATVEGGVLVVEVPRSEPEAPEASIAGEMAPPSSADRWRDCARTPQADKENIENVWFAGSVDESVAFDSMHDFLQKGAEALAEEHAAPPADEITHAHGESGGGDDSGGESGGESGDEGSDGVEAALQAFGGGARRKRERRERTAAPRRHGARRPQAPSPFSRERDERRRRAEGRSRVDPAWKAGATRMADVLVA